jgi:hypothetical protein
MQLKRLISTEYKKKAGNKPNGVIHNYIKYVARISALILKKYEWTAGLRSISDLSYLPWYQLVTITSPAIFGKY